MFKEKWKEIVIHFFSLWITLLRIFTEIRGKRLKWMNIKLRLNNEIPRGPHYAGTCAKNEEGHSVREEWWGKRGGGGWKQAGIPSDVSSSEYTAWSPLISFNLAKLRDFTAGQLFNRDFDRVLFYSISQIGSQTRPITIKILCDLPLLEEIARIRKNDHDFPVSQFFTWFSITSRGNYIFIFTRNYISTFF